MRIILNYHPVYFKELYTTPDYSYFKNEEGKHLLTWVLLTIALGLISISMDVLIASTAISLVLTLVQFIKFLINGRKVFKNNKRIDAYISELNLVNHFELVVGQEGVRLIEDEKQTIFEWSIFDTFQISDQYVFLANMNYDDYSLIIPARTMEFDDYNEFCTIANEKRDENVINREV